MTHAKIPGITKHSLESFELRLMTKIDSVEVRKEKFIQKVNKSFDSWENWLRVDVIHYRHNISDWAEQSFGN